MTYLPPFPFEGEAEGGDALDAASLDDVVGGGGSDRDLRPWEIVKPPSTRYEEEL